jgi:hypothetical protein
VRHERSPEEVAISFLDEIKVKFAEDLAFVDELAKEVGSRVEAAHAVIESEELL